MHSMEEKLKAFERLLTIMDELREQCPWDKKQTLESLSHLTIEETYELVEAIQDGDLEELKGEIGDLMLHMVFYSKIASEKKAFDVADVLHAICDKLVHRHPHIYGDVVAEDEETVKRNWEKLKLQEKGKVSILQGVPKTLPSIVKAYRIQEKVKQVGFEWEDIDDVWDKVEEELGELQMAIDDREHKKRISEEYGDVLFALINYARYLDIDPEAALQNTNKKFISRFNYIEQHAGKDLDEMTLEDMDELWDKAKAEEKKKKQ